MVSRFALPGEHEATMRRLLPTYPLIPVRSSSIVLILSLFNLFAASAPVAADETTQPAERPNILLILVDDLAWSDPAIAGHPWHKTPNIDRLAGQGLMFTQGYAPAPICSASRASILTGKTTARLGFEFVTKNEPGRQKIDMPTQLTAPPLKLNLPLDEETIAERLGRLGYTTAFFGKWHLNAHHKRYLGWSPTHGPIQQGFQFAVEDFGAHPYAWKQNQPPKIDQPGKFDNDSMVNHVCEFLGREHEAPFFAMVSSFYVHTPVKTSCRWLIRKYESIVPANTPNRERRIAYAAFLETLDHHVGRILDSLDESGSRDRTLVVFTSDNGGHPDFTANGPLRGSKWNLYEGGVRVPLIVHWPGRTRSNAKSELPVIGYDLLSTFVDAAGGDAENVDGISLLPAFDDPDHHDERALIWHFPYYHPEEGYAKAREKIGVNDFAVSKTRPQSAIRKGRHKLLYSYEEQRSELYDLSQDIGEQIDLSRERPEVAIALQAELEQQLQRMDARHAVPALHATKSSR